MPSKLQAHNCDSPTQDRLHGKGIRVWNEGKTEWHCTVCCKSAHSSLSYRVTRKAS